jgi:WXG100 family type VII secretion target
MNQLKVEPSQLGTGASGIAEVNAAIVQQVANIHAGMADLAQSWSGQAHSAAATRVAGWEADMQVSSNLLAAIGAAVTSAQQRYAEADDTVAKLWTW